MQPSPEDPSYPDFPEEYWSIIDAIKDGQSIILHAPGGTGKSYAIRHLSIMLNRYGIINYCTATTGIAAVNLAWAERGVYASTLHRWSGIGLGDESAEKLYSKVNNSKRSKEKWLSTRVLFIDEISMMGANLFDKLDFIGRKIRRSELPWGGIQLVLSGDFLQLPPVNDRWVFEASAWQSLSIKPVIFEEPKRYKDVNYFKMLLRFREAKHTSADIAVLRERLKAYDTMQLQSEADKSKLTIKPTILFSKKVDVDAFNTMELNKLTTPITTYRASDMFKPYDRNAKQDYYTNLLDDTIPPTIQLKVGAQVLLKANLDVDEGLANGSRGVVTALGVDYADVLFMNKLVHRVPLYNWKIEDKDALAVRTQLPLILAYSITTHKAQGLTLDYAICNLGASVFCPGQAYVALSRVRSLEGLLISDLHPKAITADEVALNYAAHLKEVEAEERNVIYELVFPDE